MKFKEIIFIFILSIIIIFSLGFIVNFICLLNIGIPVANNNDWIGFWGSIIGSLLGALVTVAIFKKTIEYEYDKQKKEITPFLRYNLFKNNIDDTKSSGSIALFYGEIFSSEPMYFEEIDKDFITKIKKEPSPLNPDIHFKFNIENIGLGAAIDLKVIDIDGGLVCNTSNDSNLSFTNIDMLNIHSIKIDESINIEFKAYLSLNGDYNPFTRESTYFNYLKEGKYKEDYIYNKVHSKKYNHLSGMEFAIITLQYKTLRYEVYTQSIKVEFEWHMTFNARNGTSQLKYDANIKNINEAILYK
ncbi:MAG: hypothetical protein ACLTUR_16075 [Paraclostridium sordellii]